MRSNLMLLMAATIWGMGFVAQRLGMDHMGPYTFNGLRFLLGALSLLPLLWWLKSRQPVAVAGDHRQLLTGGVLAGLVLFCAASLQQVGLLYTTAAKAGFITGLYIILVPVLGLLLRHKSGLNTWIGAIIALAGLYVLSVTDEFTIGFGDLLQVVGALFWAIHLLLVDHYSNRVAPIKLAGVQFVVCGLASLGWALLTETITLEGIRLATVPILYTGILSVGFAYTGQVVGQRYADAADAAIILSAETLFAAMFGFLLMGDRLNAVGIAGCVLIFACILAVQMMPMIEARRIAARGA